MSGEKQAVIALRGSRLEKLVKSWEFRSRLANAARLTVKTGYEAGFLYYENYLEPGPRKRYFTPVVEGESTSIKFDDALLVARSHDVGFRLEKHLPLMDVHTHPDRIGLDLSDGDMRNVLPKPVGLAYLPLVGIGTVSDQLEGSLLLLRALEYVTGRQGGVFTQMQSVYLDSYHLWPSQEFAQAIAVSGFIKACILDYRILPRSKACVFRNPEALRTFAIANR